MRWKRLSSFFATFSRSTSISGFAQETEMRERLTRASRRITVGFLIARLSRAPSEVTRLDLAAPDRETVDGLAGLVEANGLEIGVGREALADELA